ERSQSPDRKPRIGSCRPGRRDVVDARDDRGDDLPSRSPANRPPIADNQPERSPGKQNEDPRPTRKRRHSPDDAQNERSRPTSRAKRSRMGAYASPPGYLRAGMRAVSLHG